MFSTVPPRQPAPPSSNLSLEALTAAFKALSDPTRLRLFLLCAEADLSVGDLTDLVAQSQPRVSRHLKLLTEAGLLERFQEGAYVFYAAARSPFCRSVFGLLEAQAAADGGVLEKDHRQLRVLKARKAEQAQRYFADHAADWDRIRSLQVPEAEVEAAILGFVARDSGTEPDGATAPAGRLLDLGTGTGRMLALCAGHMREGIGVDRSHEMLNVARANLSRDRLGNCRVRYGDVHSLPFDGAVFDTAVLHQVLHFIERPEQVIAETARVLRPGGRLIIADFAAHDREDLLIGQAHRWPGFSDRRMTRWLREAGFAPAKPVKLDGTALTVVVWAADLQPEAGSRPAETEAA